MNRSGSASHRAAGFGGAKATWAAMTRRGAAALLGASLFAASSPACAQSAAEAAFRAAADLTVKIESTVRLPVTQGDEAGVFNGAGFVVAVQRGWVVTNAHVASRSIASLRLRARIGSWSPTRRVYVDPYLDLAIVAAIEPQRLGQVTAAPLHCERPPEIGHAVGAFGHPWGLDFTGTRGIVAGSGERYGAGALLIDAPINSGNSGGPLVSLDTGRVVGVSTSALQGTEGVENLNFAVAAHQLCRILELLRDGRDPSPVTREIVFFSDGEQTGALKVARNFMRPEFLPLRPGDIVKGLAGETGQLRSESEFVHALRGRLADVRLRVERAGRELVLAGRLPAIEPVIGRHVVQASGAVFGQARSFDPAEVNFSRVASCYIDDGSLAKSAGFEKCDAVESADGTVMEGLAQLYCHLQKAQRSDRAVTFAVKRLVRLQGRSFFAYHELTLLVDDLLWLTVSDDARKDPPPRC